MQALRIPTRRATPALLVGDPDAGAEPWVHWLCWNVPADTTDSPEDVPPEETVEALGGAAYATNDVDEIGYGGPAAPKVAILPRTSSG